MLINLLLSITCVLPDYYGSRTQRRMRSRNNESIADDLEALQFVSDSDFDVIFPDPDYWTDEKKDAEENALRRVDDACLTVADGKKLGFVLPSGGGADTNTQFCVRVRRGKLFHLCILFKPEAEIRQEQSSFNFSDDGLKRDSAEYKNLQRMKLIRRRLAGTIRNSPASKYPIPEAPAIKLRLSD